MKIYNDINEIDFDNKRAISVGGFDGIHLGHKKILETLYNIAIDNSLKSLVITFDPLPKSFFNNRPILLSISEKIKILEQTNINELLILKFDEKISQLSAFNFLELLVNKIGFKYYVVGGNHTFGKNCEGNLNSLNEFREQFNNSFEVCGVESIIRNGNVISTTLVKKLILDGNIVDVNNLLGYHFFINSEVVIGDGIGNKIGFPTANIRVPNNKIIPKNGVYLVEVYLQNKKYFGVINIGLRPTIKDLNHPCIEVHILDFKDNIYGAELEIRFLQYIRVEQKFKSVNELAIQIGKDVAICRKIIDK